MKCTITLGLFGAALFTACSANASSIVFEDDFSSGTAKSEFSGVATVEAAPTEAGFSGSPFADNILRNASTGDPASPTTLTLSGLAAHTSITISFDFLAIDSWDGTGGLASPDYFDVRLDGTSVLDVLFSVDNFFATSDVSIPSAFTELLGPVGGFADSAYAVSITVPHTASVAVFDLLALGGGWQGGSDESWGIDNVVVSTDADVTERPPGVVPNPATGGLLLSALGMAVVLRRRRR